MNISELGQYREGRAFSARRELLRKGNSWVDIKGGVTEESAREVQLKSWNADVYISDLDETDTRFPIAKIAGEMFWTTNKKGKLAIFYAKNLMPALTGQLTENSNSKELFKNFRKEFRQAVAKHMHGDVDKILFEGVKKSCSNLSIRNPALKKYYLSDNEQNSVAPIADWLGFDGIICERDKIEGVKEILAETGARRVIFKGNSYRDGKIAAFLNEEKDRGAIDDVLTIAVCTNGARFEADVYTSANQIKLAKLFGGNL